MADVKNIHNFILKWEGGLSRNTADSASANPAPWPFKSVMGWHTNKGVTYSVFASMAPKLGYENTAENFFMMPVAIWDKIFKVGYWDPWRLDSLDSQAIADLIADFAWGSGIAGSFNSIKKYLATKNKVVTTREEAAQAINELSQGNEEKIFLELIDWRINFFKSLNQPTFINGWLNRMTALKTFGLDTIKKKSN